MNSFISNEHITNSFSKNEQGNILKQIIKLLF